MQLTTGQKIGGSFGILSLATIILSILSIFGLNTINQSLSDFHDKSYQTHINFYNAQIQLTTIQRDLRNAILFPEASAQYLKSVADREKIYYEKIALVKKSFEGNPSELEQLDKLVKNWKSFVEAEVISKIKKGEAVPKTLLDQCSFLLVEINALMDEIVNGVSESVNRLYKASGVTYNNVLTSVITIIVITLLIVIILGIFLTKNIVNTLGCEPREIEKIASDIVEGNLDIAFNKGKKRELMLI